MTYVFPLLAIISIYMSFRLNCASCSYKLYPCFHLTNYYPANCSYLSSCKLSSCKLFISIHICFLQTVILQIVILLFPFWCWAVQYGLIARGADVDLKSFPLVRAHFDGLSFDKVNQESHSFHDVSCMSLRVFLL